MVLPSSCGSFRTGALSDAFLGHLSEANPMDLTVCWLKLQPAAVEVEGARICPFLCFAAEWVRLRLLHRVCASVRASLR